MVDMNGDIEIGLPVPCTAAAFACPGDKFGVPPPGLSILHVDSKGASGGPGSKSKPLNSLQVALQVAKPGTAILLADGAYEGPLVIDKALELRGRCTATVRLHSPAGGAAITVDAPPGASVRVRGLHIEGDGAGIQVTGSGKVEIEQVWLRHLRGRALGVAGKGASATFRESIAVGMTSSATPADDAGVHVAAGAKLQIVHSRVEKARTVGVRVQGQGTLLDGDLLLVTGTRNTPKGTAGMGVHIRDGARANLRSTRLSGNRTAGLALDGAAAVTLTASVIDYTLPQDEGLYYGNGARVAGGASLHLVGVRLSGNVEAGLQARGAGTQVLARGLVINDTQARYHDKLLGAGMALYKGAEADVARARISGNAGIGVQALDPGTRVALKDVLIDGTEASPGNKGAGFGIQVAGGGYVHLRRARLSGNRTIGIAVVGAGSHLDAAALLVDATRYRLSDHMGGYGMMVQEGGHAQLVGARFHANRVGGIVVAHKGSQIRAIGLLVDSTHWIDMDLPDGYTEEDFKSRGKHGNGIVVIWRARADISGSAVVANHTAGVLLWGKEDHATRGRLVGVQIRDTKRDVQNTDGQGVAVHAGFDLLQMFACHLTRNVSGNVGFRFGGGVIERSVLEDPLPGYYIKPWQDNKPADAGDTEGEAIKYADGILGNWFKPLMVKQSLIQRQSRAGALFNAPGHPLHSGPVTLSGTVIRGGAYGLATQGKPGLVIEGSLISGTSQNIAGDLGLVIPNAPDMVAGF